MFANYRKSSRNSAHWLVQSSGRPHGAYGGIFGGSQHESPSLLNLTVHAHFGGRPMMSAMLTQLLHYMKGFPEVWFARHDQIARWVLEQR